MSQLAFAVHPGEVLREEFMSPLNLKAYSLARTLHVSRTRIEHLAAEQTSVTPDTALRLSRAFGITPQFWMNMQTAYDLNVQAKTIEADLATIPTLVAA